MSEVNSSQATLTNAADLTPESRCSPVVPFLGPDEQRQLSRPSLTNLPIEIRQMIWTLVIEKFGVMIATKASRSELFGDTEDINQPRGSNFRSLLATCQTLRQDALAFIGDSAKFYSVDDRCRKHQFHDMIKPKSPCGELIGPDGMFKYSWSFIRTLTLFLDQNVPCGNYASVFWKMRGMPTKEGKSSAKGVIQQAFKDIETMHTPSANALDLVMNNMPYLEHFRLDFGTATGVICRGHLYYPWIFRRICQLKRKLKLELLVDSLYYDSGTDLHIKRCLFLSEVIADRFANGGAARTGPHVGKPLDESKLDDLALMVRYVEEMIFEVRAISESTEWLVFPLRVLENDLKWLSR